MGGFLILKIFLVCVVISCSEFVDDSRFLAGDDLSFRSCCELEGLKSSV